MLKMTYNTDNDNIYLYDKTGLTACFVTITDRIFYLYDGQGNFIRWFLDMPLMVKYIEKRFFS